MIHLLKRVLEALHEKNEPHTDNPEDQKEWDETGSEDCHHSFERKSSVMVE